MELFLVITLICVQIHYVSLYSKLTWTNLLEKNGQSLVNEDQLLQTNEFINKIH